jgi:hypothetical protein
MAIVFTLRHRRLLRVSGWPLNWAFGQGEGVPRKGAQREVIAHFSVTKLTLGAPITVLGLGTFIFFWGRDVVLAGLFKVPPPNPTDHGLNSIGNALNLWGLLILGAGFGIMAWWLFKAARNVIMNGTDAIWFEDGRLICSGPKPLDISIRDIKSAELASEFFTVSPGFVPKYEARYISILLRSGEKKRLGLGPYREIEDAILAPIKARIG